MKNIRYGVKNQIGILTISRPQQLNSLNKETLGEFLEALDMIEKDESVRCLVITGEGEKAFAGGADISEMAEMREEEARGFSELGGRVMRGLEELQTPVIAAVNGYALGGGCELALACDIIIASKNAVFSQPEVSLGVIPGFGGTQRLPLRVGLGRAKLMIYTGEYVKADEAYEIGLADKVTESEDLMREAYAMAEKIASYPVEAIAAAKKAVSYANTEGFEKETKLFGKCFAAEGQKKAMKAFLERKKQK